MTWTVARRVVSTAKGSVPANAVPEGVEPIRIPKVTPRQKRVRTTRRSVAFLQNKNRYWLYQAPANYAAPGSGDLKVSYGAFPAYGPGSGGVGGDSTGKGGGGGGGGGNWFGFGGSSDGFSMGPLTWVFAAFLSLGGLVAYLKKGSLKSLVTSLLAAGTLAASMLLRSRNLALASRMQIATAGTLTLLMGLRYLNNPSSVPAGVVTVASLLMTLGYAKDP